MHRFVFVSMCLSGALGFGPVFGQYSVYPDLGQIKAENFHVSSPVVDSNVSVVVLEDIGNSQLEGYESGWRVEHTRYRRLLIRNKKGFNAAKISISFSQEANGGGKLSTLQANTYNLENGKVVQTKVAPEDIFVDAGSDGDMVERFTFPDLREGAIIEYTYSYYSNSIYHLHSWNFQGEYPHLKSAYSVTFPAAFNYVCTKQGPYEIKKSIDSAKKMFAVGSFSVKAMTYTIHWEMDDVPAMVSESYLFDIGSYVAGIRFQLYEYTQLDTRRRIKVDNTWTVVNDRLYKNKAFGGIMTTSNHWERRELRAIVSDSAGELEKARALFAYVRDHFVSDGTNILDGDRTLKEIFRSHQGTVAEINLMLTAMLREEGLSADAVILSTRDNGLINPNYPETRNFNYVVVRLRLGGREYFLDAAVPKMGFGRLPVNCYNGYARVVSAVTDSVVLRPDSLIESSFGMVFLSDNDEHDGLTGSYTKTKGYYASLRVREELEKEGKQTFFEDVRKSFPFAVTITDDHIDSLQAYDEPVTIRYTVNMPMGREDRIYFNPMLGEFMKDNPFSASGRNYPVELPYRANDLFVLQMEIPAGYEVEELPKPVKLVLNGGDGSYEYGIAVTGRSLQLRSRLVINKTFFQTEDYSTLRDFFGAVVKTQGGMIVFRRAQK
jgi:hypothetical protein